MKKHFFLTLLLILGSYAYTHAQGGAVATKEQRQERVKALRVGVFTEKLALTSQEAQEFWPLYNETLARREAIQAQAKPQKPVSEMTDTELEAQITKHFERQQDELDLEKEMMAKLRKVLPLRKLAQIPSVEREFREVIFKKMQERKAGKAAKNK
jgi:hypothetical protein